MTGARLRRTLGALWPQRVRIRLTLLYAALFLVAGGALLGLTYGLVAATLPATSPAATRSAYYRAQQARQKQVCTAHPVAGKPSAANRSLEEQCKQVSEYLAGARAGAQSQKDRTMHTLLLDSLLGLGVMTVASGGAGWLVSGRVLRPVRAITGTARRASEQHLGERIGMTGPKDELRELADTFDEMLERLDRAFAAQRVFVANASHELRTPLTVMRTAIDVTLAKPDRTQAQLEDMAERVRRCVDKSERMIDGLLTLAASEHGAACRDLLDLSALAEDALEAAAAGTQRLGLTMTVDLDPAPILGDQKLLERMVWNLVDNSVRHNEPGGWIRLSTGTASGEAFLRIANSGRVVPAEVVPDILEPFRRLGGRTAGQDGVGLGLSIVRSVSAAHDAQLNVSTPEGGGLDVRVALPARYLSEPENSRPSNVPDARQSSI